MIALAEKIGSPIVKALLGKAVVPDDHPPATCGLGLLGMGPSEDVMRDCDGSFGNTFAKLKIRV